ncbi:MAG: hypothetical protein M3P48_06010 [Actinomycetota bacterium]|nr:hypothetical protein [Actinomycetota bacterium]
MSVVAELPAPPAARLARARWRDKRLVGGVLLVLLSVISGAKVIAEADESVPVWAVTAPMAPDAVLTEDDLRRVNVRIGDSVGSYVLADGRGPVGYVVQRDLQAGELLPAAAVVRAELADRRRLTVAVPDAVAKGLGRNSVVDVYVVPDQLPGAREPREARLVLAQVTVATDPARNRGLGGGRGEVGVELVVPGDEVQELLSALATGSPALVQVPKVGAAAESAS